MINKEKGTANFVQVVCEKHEFIEVTTTTSSSDGEVTVTIAWQCKNCGLIFPLSKLNPHSEIN